MKRFTWETTERALKNKPLWKIEAVKSVGFTAGLSQTFFVGILTPDIDLAIDELRACGEYRDEIYVYTQDGRGWRMWQSRGKLIPLEELTA